MLFSTPATSFDLLQLNPRDRYLFFLAQARAAEAEYIAYEAKREEEALLRRLQLQHARRHTAPPSNFDYRLLRSNLSLQSPYPQFNQSFPKQEAQTRCREEREAALLREQLCQVLLKDHQSSVPVNCSKYSRAVPHQLSPCGFRTEGPPETAKENCQSKFEFSKNVSLGLGLEDEVVIEIRDTIHAILASLADSSASRPNQAQTRSSMKGKDKESVTEAGSTPPSQTATSKDVVRSFDQVERIEAAFETLNDDFRFPSQLDFLSTPHLHDVGDGLVKGTSRLAFSARNHSVRYYEQALTSLLSRLDSIDSFGNEALRTKRKEVVRRVETALDELERGIEASHKVASDALTRKRKPEEAQVLPPLSDSMTKGTFPDVNATGSSPIVFDKVATEKEDVISSSNAETISAPSDILTTDPEGGSPSTVSVSETSRSSDEEQDEEINTSQPPSGEEVVADAHAILDVPIEAAVPIVPTVLDLGSAVELEDVNSFLLTNETDAPQSPPSHSSDDLGSDWSDVEEK